MTAPVRNDLTGLAPLHPVLPHVIIYSKPVCPNCDMLKRQLHKKGLTPINIDITETPEAYEELKALNLLSTPIVLVHNVFERPVYFWGKGAVPVDQGKFTATAVSERFAHLITGGYIDAQAHAEYIDELAARALAHDERQPSVTPEEFIELADGLAPEENADFRRVKLAPGNELTSVKSEIPSVLMTN